MILQNANNFIQKAQALRKLNFSGATMAKKMCHNYESGSLQLFHDHFGYFYDD